MAKADTALRREQIVTHSSVISHKSFRRDGTPFCPAPDGTASPPTPRRADTEAAAVALSAVASVLRSDARAASSGGGESVSGCGQRQVGFPRGHPDALRQGLSAVLRKIAHQQHAAAAAAGAAAAKRGGAGAAKATGAGELKGPAAAAAAALRRAAAEALLVLASTGEMEPSTRLEWTPLLVSWATEEGAPAEMRDVAREALWELSARDANGDLGQATAASWLSGVIRCVQALGYSHLRLSMRRQLARTMKSERCRFALR